MISFEFLWTHFAFLKKGFVALLVVLREAADCGGICSITQPMSTHVHAAALHAACGCCMLCIRVGMWYNARPQQGRGDLCKTDADSVSCKAHSTCVCMLDTMSAMDKSIEERSSGLKLRRLSTRMFSFSTRFQSTILSRGLKTRKMLGQVSGCYMLQYLEWKV